MRIVGTGIASPFRGGFIKQDDDVQTRGSSRQTLSVVTSSDINEYGMANTHELTETKLLQSLNKSNVKHKILATHVDKLRNVEKTDYEVYQGRY